MVSVYNDSLIFYSYSKLLYSFNEGGKKLMLRERKEKSRYNCVSAVFVG